ncbi:MAG: hypothetical protein P5702_01965 [Limnospira sp. PMC 1291.21]|uniref:Uncharacterized protein n=1 Tax=Limnospira fusiformis PMC 851.14 TaxID=2219512 RepID=A0ABU9EHR4_LIMFS|nr:MULTISPECIES: hypothetical protein [Limnospira]MDC0836405.1 hypothetical protein [Limnoraphis robusta]MDY7054728.1 hypothetical protein [Limnospira fusiformis LS22]MDT9176656.1 hypothetical protein [Limnospira sp. PMC 1238.20]MDT9189232.1 hypothetical protein [Limnospira sp. PMC 894.15]MDT9194023.1 hypothetical protein [Limnospira sp. PMC 1245.20]
MGIIVNLIYFGSGRSLLLHYYRQISNAQWKGLVESQGFVPSNHQ